MSKNLYQRWFFDGAYVVAGRPKMENMLMHYARAKYDECLVYESFLPSIALELLDQQNRYYEQNKRLKKVEIRLSKDDGSNIRWLRIGEQHLTIRKVREEIDYA